jgi:hypothetical protein
MRISTWIRDNVRVASEFGERGLIAKLSVR